MIAILPALAGCGESATTPDSASSTRPTTSKDGHVVAGSPGSVSLEVGGAVPLGSTRRQVVRRLGPPAVPMRRKDARYRCMFYAISGQPPGVQLQYCFRGRKLRLLSTYVHD